MAKRVGVDKWIFFTSLLLVSVGLAMVFSASAVVSQERFHSAYMDVGRQAGWALAGVLSMIFLMRVDYRRAFHFPLPPPVHPPACDVVFLPHLPKPPARVSFLNFLPPPAA